MAISDTNKRLLWGIGIVLVVVTMWFYSTKNSLVTMEEAIDASWAQVENQLQRRYDLIPNLVNTVKGYVKQEKEIFTNIAEARAKLAGARGVSDKIAASQQMESALSRLLVVVERYPDLKSNQTFQRLMDELAGSENRIAVERRRYNENVKHFNAKIRRVPTSFVANQAGFEKKDYFQIDNAARQTPNVQF